MREIKFRAWDNTKKQMRFSFDGWNESADCLHDMLMYIQEWGYELMQYTGLKDKNGKEIYEGDIVNQYGFYSRAIVKFGKYKRRPFMNGDLPRKNYGFYLEKIPYVDKNTGIENFGDISILDTTNGIEVIGNIYKNPEMLK